MTEHTLTVEVFDKDKDPDWHACHGHCSCGWFGGNRGPEGKERMERLHAKHVKEVEARRFVVTVDGKEHVVKPDAVREVK